MRISDWSSDLCSSDLALVMRLGDLAAEPLATVVDGNAETLAAEHSRRLAHIAGLLGADTGEQDLLRRQPQRQGAAMVFQQHADEAFQATKHGMVDQQARKSSRLNSRH